MIRNILWAENSLALPNCLQLMELEANTVGLLMDNGDLVSYIKKMYFLYYKESYTPITQPPIAM